MKDEFTIYIASFIDELVRSGVRQFVISPGSRSTPLALLITAHPQCRVWMQVDERSAGFFALGIAKASRSPVALVCTSGTAAANYTPAVVEAYYSRHPLIVLSADRPREMREVGASQTINQLNLYGSHVKWFNDMPTPEAKPHMITYARFTANRAVSEAMAVPCGPVHLNFPLREPLLPDFALLEEWQAGRRQGMSEGRQKGMSEGRRDGSSDPSNSLREEADELRHDTTSDLTASSESELPYTVVWHGKQHLDGQMITKLAHLFRTYTKGLIVCGPLDEPQFANAVTTLAAQLDFPLIADPLSQLRSGSHPMDQIIDAYDGFLRDERVVARLAPEVIIRFGAMPVSKAWQLFMEQHPHCIQFVVDDGNGWRDPALLASHHIIADASELCEALTAELAKDLNDDQGTKYVDSSWLTTWHDINRITREVLGEWSIKCEDEADSENEIDRKDEIHWNDKIDNIVNEYSDNHTLFEGRLFIELQQALPEEAALFIGNSMPIRDLDTFFTTDEKQIRILANRGANGIDGLVSTALGVSTEQEPTVLVLGDLSFYHDMNGLLAAKLHQLNLTIIIVNNDGGGIFSFLPQAQVTEYFEPLFGTPIGLSYEHAASLYGGDFVSVRTWAQFNEVFQAAMNKQGLKIIEVVSDRERNVVLHRKIWQRVSERLTPLLEQDASR